MTTGIGCAFRRISTGKLLLMLSVVFATCWVQAIASLDCLSGAQTSTGSLPFTLAFAVANLLLVMVPRRIERLLTQAPWATVALGVSLVTSLAGLSYGQDLFDSIVFGVLSSAVLGFACVTLIVATMLPAINRLSRVEFISLVFGSYVAKRALELLVTDIPFSAIVAAVAFVCPFAIMFMVNRGTRRESARTVIGGPKSAISPIWIVALAVSAVCTITLLGGTVDVSTPVESHPDMLVWDLMGSALLLLVSGLFLCRSTILATYRQLFVIGSVVGLLTFSGGMVNGADVPLGPLSIFCGVLLWLPVYDCARERVCPPLRLYGACGIGQIVLGMLAQGGGMVGVAALWVTCGLALVAGLVISWLETKTALPYNSPEVAAGESRSLSEMLDGVCNSLAADKGLSQRESEVLALLAKGMSRQAIGERLLLSEATVKTHIYRIYAKLDVHSQTELAELLYG